MRSQSIWSSADTAKPPSSSWRQIGSYTPMRSSQAQQMKYAAGGLVTESHVRPRHGGFERGFTATIGGGLRDDRRIARERVESRTGDEAGTR